MVKFVSRLSRELGTYTESYSRDDSVNNYPYEKIIPIGNKVEGRYHGYNVLGFTEIGKRIELLRDEFLGYWRRLHVLFHEIWHNKLPPELAHREDVVDYKAKQSVLSYG